MDKQEERNEIYINIVNEFIKMEGYNSTRVILLNLDTLSPFIQKYDTLFEGSDTIIYLENIPGTNSNISISKEKLNSLYQLSMIDSTDINYIFKDIGNNDNFFLSKQKIHGRTILRNELKELIRKYSLFKYNEKDNKLGIKSYASFSQPIFTKDNKTVIFFVNRTCGDLCGSGERIIMKFENGKWVLKQRKTTWVS